MKTKLEIYFRIILYWIFRFDKWHIGNLTIKPYAKEVITFLNNKSKKGSVVEIGCGLGDLIRNLNYNEKFGFDINYEVIHAASFMNIFYKKGTFAKYDFLKDQLNRKYDVIILINWIHDINPVSLKSKIETFYLLNLNDDGYIILDTLSNSGYTFKHDINYLNETIGSKIKLLGEFNHGRNVWALKKVND